MNNYYILLPWMVVILIFTAILLRRPSEQMTKLENNQNPTPSKPTLIFVGLTSRYLKVKHLMEDVGWNVESGSYYDTWLLPRWKCPEKYIIVYFYDRDLEPPLYYHLQVHPDITPPEEIVKEIETYAQKLHTS